MGLNYDKYKKEQEAGNNQWASYSDLFMVLSFVFLLLYVVSSLKNTTFSIKKQMEYERLVAKTEDLDRQVRAYDSLKEQYLNQQASAEEQQTYDRLMNQLELVKLENQENRETLKKKIEESEKKEAALNEYQKVIKNIINANMVAKSRLKKRDSLIQQKADDIANQKDVIYEKSVEIAQKNKVVKNLEENILEKRRKITENENVIKQLEGNLNEQMVKLKESYKKNEITIQEFKQKMIEAQEVASTQIAYVEQEKNKIQQDLAQSTVKLEETQKSLENTEATLLSAQESLKEKQSQVEGLSEKISQTQQSLEAKKQALAEQNRQIASLDKELSESSLKVQELGSQNKKLEKSVEQLADLAFAKKNLAKKIDAVLKNNNIPGVVDKETGEVEIHFKEYFDTGKFDLKPSMKEMLEKFIPKYAKELLKDKDIKEKIQSVEIIGFASPTYKGKLLDPTTLKPEDRAGVDFNLNLSFFRSRSIFKYIFDINNMKFEYQKDLQGLIKVTGRSFLAEEIKGRNIASNLSRQEFCSKYDCLKSQKVIIKFNME